MENKRLISLILAIVAMSLVILAGKSCTEDINEKNKTAKSQKGAESASVNVITPHDLITDPAYIAQTTAPPVTEPVSYDLFGNPVTTEPTEAMTDANGQPVTFSSEETEAQTAAEGETIAAEEASAATTMPKISGFNHGQYDAEGNLKPTLPSDYALVIQ